MLPVARIIKIYRDFLNCIPRLKVMVLYIFGYKTGMFCKLVELHQEGSATNKLPCLVTKGTEREEGGGALLDSVLVMSTPVWKQFSIVWCKSYIILLISGLTNQTTYSQLLQESE